MKLAGWKGRINNLRFCVLGDAILDHYVQGIVTRLSPEAPVPILEVNGGFYRLGGAANVAANLAGIGAKVTLITMIGDDLDGAKLLKLLNETEMGFSVSKDKTRKTTKKTRVRSVSQQICRLDYEDRHPIDIEVFNELTGFVKEEIKKSDAFLVVDYGKGLLSQKFLLWLEENAIGVIPTYYNPKPPVPVEMRGPRCVIANKQETKALLGNARNLSDNDYVKGLRELFAAESAMMTMGEDGLMLWVNNKIHVVPAQKQEVYDVSGAGDTVLATYALCRTLGFDAYVSAYTASRAASFVLQEMGTSPVKWKDIKEVKW